jgi:hypothetical protein
MVRVSLRYVRGSSVIKKATLPATMVQLLEVATRKLGLESPAKRVFGADGGEFDHEDFALIEKDDMLFISCGEDFLVPQIAETLDPVSVFERPEVLDKMSAEWVLSHQESVLQVLQRHGSTYIVQASALRAIRKLGAEWLQEHVFSCRSSATRARQSRYGGRAGFCQLGCESQCTILMERLADRDEPDGAWAINAAQVRIAALEVLGAMSERRLCERTLETIMLNDDHASVRASALMALRRCVGAGRIRQWHAHSGSWTTPEWMPSVLSRLVDAGPGVRLAALELLASLPASLLQMHAPRVRSPLRGCDWDADEEDDPKGGGDVLETLKQQRAAARKAVLDRLHDLPVFDWLDSDLIVLVGRFMRAAPHALSLFARCSRRLLESLRGLIAGLRAPLAIAMRSPDVSKRFPHVWGVHIANFSDQVFSAVDCSLLTCACPCLLHLNHLRFSRVSFQAAALSAWLTSVVDVAEETGFASRLESLTLYECSFADEAQAMGALAQALPLLTGLRRLDLKGSGDAADVMKACHRVNIERLASAGCHYESGLPTDRLSDPRDPEARAHVRAGRRAEQSRIWRCSSCSSPRVLSQCGSVLSCSASNVSCTSLSVRDDISADHYEGISFSVQS